MRVRVRRNRRTIALFTPNRTLVVDPSSKSLNSLHNLQSSRRSFWSWHQAWTWSRAAGSTRIESNRSRRGLQPKYRNKRDSGTKKSPWPSILVAPARSSSTGQLHITWIGVQSSRLPVVGDSRPVLGWAAYGPTTPHPAPRSRSGWTGWPRR